MKYIRTKNGVYEIVDIYESKYVIGYEDSVALVVYKEDVINQADTIEELCDTYVFVGDDKDGYGNPLLFNIKQDKVFIIKYYFESNVIYSAIWTDKGLIYVAKMNEKGELELL